MTSQADLRAIHVDKEPMGVSFEVLHGSRSKGRILVGMPGEHNVLNALARHGGWRSSSTLTWTSYGRG